MEVARHVNKMCHQYWVKLWCMVKTKQKPKNKTEHKIKLHLLLNWSKQYLNLCSPPEVLQIIYVFNKYTQPSQNKIQWSYGTFVFFEEMLNVVKDMAWHQANELFIFLIYLVFYIPSLVPSLLFYDSMLSFSLIFLFNLNFSIPLA